MQKVAILVLLALAGAAQAQSASYVTLGEDATGDAQAEGVPFVDTWIDINGMAVETVDQDLVFWLGLQGTTTEVGQYCWMAAFEFGGTEYVGLDCYEGVAYEDDNTLSSVNPPATSRGENVASSVVFENNAAKITVPLDAIGASYGDEIGDIYGLTYATRGLVVADTIPDEKRTAAAETSLGTYTIGGTPLVVTVESLTHYFDTNGTIELFDLNGTSDTFVYNWTTEAQNVTAALDWNVTGGSFNVTVLDGNGTEMMFGQFQATFTDSYDFLNTTNGTWQITFQTHNLTGSLSMDLQAILAAPTPVPTGNVTADGNETLDGAAKESPGAGMFILPVIGLVAWLRRRA